MPLTALRVRKNKQIATSLSLLAMTKGRIYNGFMPKENKISINLNLLNPQSNPEKIYFKAMRWILSTGRYILIVVELVVFVAFLSRFKLDSDLANNTEAIDQKIPFIESYKPDEILIRQTQQQLSLLKTIKQDSPNYTAILSSIASQTPTRVVLKNIDMQKLEGVITLKVTGQAQNNNELSSFLNGLRGNPNFSEINLDGVTLDEGLINFTLTGKASFTQSQQQNL